MSEVVERVGVREVLLRITSDGRVASILGPCVCGEAKREWHPLCLKEKSLSGENGMPKI